MYCKFHATSSLVLVTLFAMLGLITVHLFDGRLQVSFAGGLVNPHSFASSSLQANLALPSADTLKPTISITNAWAEATTRGAGRTALNSAVYLDIENETAGDDSLLGARADLARAIDLHETHADSGSIRMRAVCELVLPAGGTVALKPGGPHMMLLDLRQDLIEGSTIPVTLVFEQAGEVLVQVPVRAVNIPSMSYDD